MIKEKLKLKIIKACEDALAQGKLGQLLSVSQEVTIDEPHKASHGDFCCQIALRLASSAQLPAIQIARTISANIAEQSRETFQIRVAEPGFLNVEVGPDWLAESLCHSFAVIADLDLQPNKLGEPASEEGLTYFQSYIQDYIQVEAHARAILQNALDERINMLAETVEPPYISPDEWQTLNVSYKSSPVIFAPLFDNESQIVAHQKSLILHLDDYLADDTEPRSSLDLIAKLSKITSEFRQFCKLATFSQRERKVAEARLGIVLVCQKLLVSTLGTA